MLRNCDNYEYAILGCKTASIKTILGCRILSNKIVLLELLYMCVPKLVLKTFEFVITSYIEILK